MTSPTFDEIWVRRLGPEATSVLRRNGYISLTMGPVIAILAITCSFALASHSSIAKSVGGIEVAAILAAAWIWIRSSKKLAAALSKRFGV